MARGSYDPFMLGFDRMFKHLDEMIDPSRTVVKYPPYNIVKHSDDLLEIEMAVAGFDKEEIEIELADGSLTVKGVPATEDKAYVYKGIATRTFIHKFALADTIKVQGAELVNGMLRIRLENVIPEHRKPRKIEIGGPRDGPQLLTEEIDAASSDFRR